MDRGGAAAFIDSCCKDNCKPTDERVNKFFRWLNICEELDKKRHILACEAGIFEAGYASCSGVEEGQWQFSHPFWQTPDARLKAWRGGNHKMCSYTYSSYPSPDNAGSTFEFG